MLKCQLYREEVGELAVQEFLQLALVELVLVSIVSRVVVENCYQCIHCTFQLARHSAVGGWWEVLPENSNVLL